MDDLEPHGFDQPDLERRVLLKAATLGAKDMLTAEQARAWVMPFRSPSPHEAETMEAACEKAPYQPHIAPEIKW